MKITIPITNETADKLRAILTTCITGGNLTFDDTETVMHLVATILVKLPPPKKQKQ